MEETVDRRLIANRPITERQIAVLRFIRDSLAQNGYPPTIREIAKYLGSTSCNCATDHLKALERRGYIAHGPRNTARGIRICREVP